jgi:hypothetical protein
MFIENISKFVIDFLESNKNPNAVEAWKSKKTQQSFLKTVKKQNIKVKDASKPRRGKSAFLYYCENNRSKLKEANPEMSVKEIVSTLGANWQKLKKENPSEVEKFEKMSVKDRDRYKSEMRGYVPILSRKYEKKPKEDGLEEDDGEENKPEKKEPVKRSKRDHKEVLYSNYVKSRRVKTKKNHPELDSDGVIAYLARKWEKMPDIKKEKYSKKSVKKTD